MNQQLHFKRLFSLLTAALICAACSSRQAASPGITAPDPATGIISALAYLDLNSPILPAAKTMDDYARSLGGDPQRVMAAIKNRIALVPYEGSLADPTHLLAGGVANSLDRAQLVAALLGSSGFQTRIVSVDQDGKLCTATYPAMTPSNLAPVRPNTVDGVRKEVQSVAPMILTKLQRIVHPVGGLTGAGTEKRLYWVQYRRSSNWSDLIPSDMTIDPRKRANAQVLSARAQSSLSWRVRLAVTNSYGDGAADQTVLTYSAPAIELNGASVTFVNQPDASGQFIPTLFVGDKKVTGSSFSANQSNHELTHQLLILETMGPSGTRRYERLLVGSKGDASDSERLMEIATLARVTVVSGFVSDDELERSLVSNLSQTAKLVFGDADGKVPANFAAPDAIAVLDASHRVAGQIGEAGAKVLAFQGRPALVMEHDFIEVSGENLRRAHTFDLVDPGHSLYAPGVTDDVLVQAAIEQAVADAYLEAQVARGANVVTSRSEINQLVSSNAPLDLDKLPSLIGADIYGTARPAYRLGSAGNGIAAGWRFDPGPQVVPVLENYSGGTRSWERGSMARVRRLCGMLPTTFALVPTEMFPQKLMVGGLVEYDCKLAQTYTVAADRLGNIASQLSGNAPASPPPNSDDLDKMIAGLGPSLLKDVVLGAVGQADSALAERLLLGPPTEYDSAAVKVLHYLGGVDADLLSDKLNDQLKQVLNDIQKSQQAGKSSTQIATNFAKSF